MIFGTVALNDALGAVLAHSVPLAQGRLRKGQVLTKQDLVLLRAAGHTQITVARREKGDLGEDEAAARLAAALAGSGLRTSAAATGRVNLFATKPGVLRLDPAQINAFNAVNPMITVATLPQFQRVDTEGMVATIKIISYAVPADDVAIACAAVPDALSVLPARYRTATLIETQINAVPSEKGRQALAGRLARLGVALTPRVVVPHRDAALVDAIGAAAGDVVFILTASATADLHDLGPDALRQAGGEVTQFGMPVDPGNLLFLGRYGPKPVIGLPGCARSPALNGADWVLERVICGVTLAHSDFARMGVGGLLKEIPTRPKPRGDI